EDTAANGFVVMSGYVFTTAFIQSPRTASLVVALNAITGSEVWRYQAPADLFAIAVGPILSPGPIPPTTSTASVPIPTPSPSPSLAHLNVYLANAAEVAALHATTGKLRWHAPAASTTAAAVVAITGTVAYSCRLSGCPDGGKSGVHGVRGSDGRELWYNDLGGDLPDLWPITTAGGTIFVAARTPDQHEQIIALNPPDGSTRWAVEVPGDILYVPLVFGDDTLYLAAGNAVYMLKAADGQLLKQLEGEFPVAAGSGMLYTLTMPFAVTGQNYLSAWHTSDWTRLWRVQQDVASPVLLADGALYAGVAADQFVAIDAASGQARWTRGDRPEPLGGFVDLLPILDHGTLYVHFEDSQIVAFDPATGKQQWAAQIGAATPGDGGFMLAGGYLFTSAFTRIGGVIPVAAFDAATGRVVWRHQAGAFGSIAVGP